MQEPLTVLLLTLSDLVPEQQPQPTEPPELIQSRQYTLDKIPAICPHCGQRCIRQDTLRVWYCGLCGAYQERKERIVFELSKQEFHECIEHDSQMVEFTCVICGTVELKQRKAKRVLCKKHETERINANRTKGIKLSIARNTYICANCGEIINQGTKYWDGSKHTRKRYHQHCFDPEKKKDKTLYRKQIERPQLGA